MHLSKNFMPFVFFFKEKKDAVLQNNFVTNWYVQGHIPGEVKEVKCQDPKQCQEIYSQVPSEDKQVPGHACAHMGNNTHIKTNMSKSSPTSRLAGKSRVMFKSNKGQV